MDEPRNNHIKECLQWIVMVSLSPMAFLLFMLMALYSLLRFLFKVALLFIIVAINTPFAMMYNLSVLVFQYNLARFQKSNPSHWNWSDPRASVGIEVKLIVSDFFKVVAGELLLVVSTGIITYFTAPLSVFYYSTVVWLVAIAHKWLNTDCLSKTALSCLCDGYGLSPMMFLFSFIGFFDIGCHPVAKCSFAARKAFLFVRDVPNQFNKEDNQDLIHRTNPNHQTFIIEEGTKESNLEEGHSKLNEKDGLELVLEPSNRLFQLEKFEVDVEQGDRELNVEVNWHQFNGVGIDPKQRFIEFLKWNAFERGLFQLSPRIDFINRTHGKYIFKSFMVLKLLGVNLCEYPVERLELPEDYSKANELFNFLVILSLNDGFVTDKMRGRYEHSLTMLEIAEGVEESVGYRIIDPIDKRFVVAGCASF